jgi:hypothetical protein
MTSTTSHDADDPTTREAATGSSARILDPIDRVSEVLFGLIMVLTFTGSLSVANAGRTEVREMLVGALGCNLAWGIIDGVFYLMGCLGEKGRGLRIYRAVRETSDPGAARRLITAALPPVVAAILKPQEIETLHQRLKEQPTPPPRARLDKDSWLGAAGVFLLVFLSTFPVILPFIFMRHPMYALRVSNTVAVVMLSIAGWTYGRCIGRRPWAVGLLMVLIGSAMVGLTIALGG